MCEAFHKYELEYANRQWEIFPHRMTLETYAQVSERHHS